MSSPLQIQRPSVADRDRSGSSDAAAVEVGVQNSSCSCRREHCLLPLYTRNYLYMKPFSSGGEML